MSQDVEVKIKDVNGEEYSVKINQDAKVMDLLIKIKSEKIMASAEKLKLYDSLSILLRGKCITMEQNLYSENLPTLKDLGVDKESEMKIVFSSNKDNKPANFIKFDEIPDSFKSEDKDEITLKIKVNNKESYDIKMNKGAKISDLIAKVKSDKKIKELADGNDFFKITHFKNVKNDTMNLQLCHTGFQDIKLKNLFKETNAILDIKFGNVDEKNYAKFDQSPSNIPIENILINDADSSNIENINDNDTITLIICDFGGGKEVTKLSVKKTTTMRDIKKQLQQKYNLSDERINELYLWYASYNMFYDLDLTVEKVCNTQGFSEDIEKREVRVYAKDFDFSAKISESEKATDNKSEKNSQNSINKNGIKINWKLIILGLLFLLGAGLAWSLGASWFLIGGLAVVGLVCLGFGFMWSKLKSCIRCIKIGASIEQENTNLLSLGKEKEPGLDDRGASTAKKYLK